MTDRDRPSARLRETKRELLKAQDLLDGLGYLYLTLGCPASASAASRAGDAVEDLRRAVESDADRLEAREEARDRQVELAAAGGVSADALDGGGSP